MAKGKLFKKPAGESKHRWSFLGMNRRGPVTCELCGTVWPRLDEDEGSYFLFKFMGIMGVEECCGAVLDKTYEELGDTFAIEFLQAFAKDPSNMNFSFLRYSLPEILTEARKKSEEITKTIVSAEKQLPI